MKLVFNDDWLYWWDFYYLMSIGWLGAYFIDFGSTPTTSIFLAILVVGIHPIKTSAITAEEAIQIVRNIDNCRKNIDNIFDHFNLNPQLHKVPDRLHLVPIIYLLGMLMKHRSQSEGV